MAGSIARRRVRTAVATTTVELRKMAAIFQIVGWKRHAAQGPVLKLGKKLYKV